MKAVQIRKLFSAILLGLCVAGLVVFWLRRPDPDPIMLITPTATLSPTPAPMQIHVVGAVQCPGVYALTPGSRITHAVQAAGGLRLDADAERVNLADFLEDGQQLRIPQRGEELAPSPTPLAAALRGGTNTINLNTASASELESLPGIGPAYAERIIAYRQEHGPFESCQEIMQIKGIGEGCYEQIVSQISVE